MSGRNATSRFHCTKLPVALVLTLASGAAALAHQILWTRRLVDVLGASADTFSKVVGAFFVGLALGAWIASRSNRAAANFWKRVALAELGVAVLAIPALFSAELSNLIHSSATLTPWMKLSLPVLIVTPPATAMGLVVPWMVRALSGNEGFRARHSVWLYAVNTFGGVLGIGLVVLEALPRLGLRGSGVSAIILNLLVAAGALALAGGKTCAEPAQTEAGPSTLPAIDGILAFASGFLVLALEVVLQHQLAQVTINSLFSSAIVLTLVLISLSAAAALAPLLVRWSGDSRRAMNTALVAAAILCLLQPFLLIGSRNGLNILPYELPPMPYTWAVFRLGILAICPMLLATGFVFPLLLRNAVERSRHDANRTTGLLLAWNGVGGWLGAELCQSFLAPTFGLWRTVILVGAAYAVVLVLADRLPGFRTRIATTGLAVIAVAISMKVAGLLPQATVAPTERLAALAVGREGVVATLECGPGDWRMLFNNSYTLGGSKAQFNQERQGLVPLLIHGHPQTVATLGVATGGTVAGTTLHSSVQQIEAIELSPLVLRYAREFFSPYNRNIFSDRRARFIAEDARWVVAGKTHAYDVVVGDLFLPWRTGEGRLFTLEHFQNVRRSLKPDGLFCQWLPLFQLTRPQFEVIARTFQTVFPDAFIVRGDFYSELPIIGLVGGREFSKIDWSAIEAGCARIRAEGRVGDPLVRHVEGIAMLMVGPLSAPGPGAVNTLANAWLEWDAGRNILGMQTPWFVAVPYAEYIRSVHRAGQLFIPHRLRNAHDTGQFYLTLEIASKIQSPALEQLKSQAFERTPAALREDTSADWKQWPMGIKPN